MALYIDAETKKQTDTLIAKLPAPPPPREDVDRAVAANGIAFYQAMLPEQAKLSIMTRAALTKR